MEQKNFKRYIAVDRSKFIRAGSEKRGKKKEKHIYATW
jgi:hypothetical protein